MIQSPASRRADVGEQREHLLLPVRVVGDGAQDGEQQDLASTDTDTTYGKNDPAWT